MSSFPVCVSLTILELFECKFVEGKERFPNKISMSMLSDLIYNATCCGSPAELSVSFIRRWRSSGARRAVGRVWRQRAVYARERFTSAARRRRAGRTHDRGSRKENNVHADEIGSHSAPPRRNTAAIGPRSANPARSGHDSTFTDFKSRPFIS